MSVSAENEDLSVLKDANAYLNMHTVGIEPASDTVYVEKTDDDEIARADEEMKSKADSGGTAVGVSKVENVDCGPQIPKAFDDSATVEDVLQVVVSLFESSDDKSKNKSVPSLNTNPGLMKLGKFVNKKLIEKDGNKYGLTWVDNNEIRYCRPCEQRHVDSSVSRAAFHVAAAVPSAPTCQYATSNSTDGASAPGSVFAHFYGSDELSEKTSATRKVLLDETSYMSRDNVRGGYFGRVKCSKSYVGKQHCFVDVAEPFSLVCVGRQGAGKTHTLNVILESCMGSFPQPVEAPVIGLKMPMCGLVLRLGSCADYVCEALGLYALSPQLKDLGVAPFQESQQITVLVSPNNRLQRREFYKRLPDNVHLNVKTLRFQWDKLDAVQLKKLMGLDESDHQLYVGDILRRLGELHRDHERPNLDTFINEFEATCSRSQLAPMQQRLNLLRSFVTEDNDPECAELPSLMQPGNFIICDLTDPILSEIEVSSVFQVLLQQFRQTYVPSCGKVVAFDEAHKYLVSAQKSDSLSKDIVSTVRQMHHENIRVLLSTQSPLDLPHEIVELSTVMVLHEFQSREWYRYLESKLALPAKGFEIVRKLECGHALLCSNKITLSLLDGSHKDDARLEDSESIVVQVRRRITTDLALLH
jgi:hypothetical protein